MRKFYALILPALCFLILLLASCTENADVNEKSSEVKVLVGTDGESYHAIVGEDGFPVFDEKGKLSVALDDGEGGYGKNANGEYVTSKTESPNVLSSKDEIHTRFFRMKVPKGWENVSESLAEIKYTKNSKTAKITVNERSSLSVKECEAEVEEILSSLGKLEKEHVSLSFAEAEKISVEKRISVYVFSAEGRTYFIKVFSDEELFDEIDFEEIINTIKFRKGE